MPIPDIPDCSHIADGQKHKRRNIDMTVADFKDRNHNSRGLFQKNFD